jgi:hydroxypyruvate reductase
MKVLFLPEVENLHPWYDDVYRPCVGRHDIELFDATKPVDAQLRGVQVVIDQGGSVGTREQITLAMRCGVKLWQVLGNGTDHVDLKYLKECGLAVANTPGPFSAIALAEHCMFLMLYLTKQHSTSQRKLADCIRCAPLVSELHGQTLGLVGFGASGQELARRACAFGMRVIAIDTLAPSPDLLMELRTEYIGDASRLEPLLRQADVVSLHVPLTNKTRHLINRQTLRCMKRNAILINVARGDIVDEDALWVALSESWIQGAGLDVFSREPVNPNHRLLSLENVVATPHIAGVTDATSRRRGLAVVENLDRVAQGLAPLNQVEYFDRV